MLDEFGTHETFDNFEFATSFPNLGCVQQHRKILFALEANAQSDTSELFSDIVKFLGSRLVILAECGLRNEPSLTRASHRADSWVLYGNERLFFLS
jgi:hypothetical protein